MKIFSRVKNIENRLLRIIASFTVSFLLAIAAMGTFFVTSYYVGIASPFTERILSGAQRDVMTIFAAGGLQVFLVAGAILATMILILMTGVLRSRRGGTSL